MSRFRQSLEQAIASAGQGSGTLSEWPETTVPELLRILWRAYDRVQMNILNKVDIAHADLQIERSVSALLHDEIAAILIERGGFPSYVVSHERWEIETLDPKISNRPPQYDICFVWYAQRELKWPCEAKVLKTESDVAPYIADIRNEFIPCTYGPLSSSGAMLGLLLTGAPHQTLKNISKKMNLPVIAHAEFPERPHGITHLTRTPRPGKSYPISFQLHHLILHLRPVR